MTRLEATGVLEAGLAAAAELADRDQGKKLYVNVGIRRMWSNVVRSIIGLTDALAASPEDAERLDRAAENLKSSVGQMETFAGKAPDDD